MKKLKSLEKYRKKIKFFLSEFELAISSLDAIIVPKLVVLCLNVLKNIFLFDVEKNKKCYKKLLEKKIIKLLTNKNLFFSKPQLYVNPNNIIWVKKKFNDLFVAYQWNLIPDKSIDLYSCKVFFKEGGGLDATTDAWIKRIYKFICQDNDNK